jgi:eukaryotic-like serine/threonine-protein kinase
MSSRDEDEPASALGHAATVAPGHAATVAPGLAATVATVDDTDVPRIGERPEADQLARAVARTRIGNKLFAKAERVNLGRYHLLEMVGAGGMGVVWGAWDPELERRVAIKLVKATMQAARDRIQLEGQALAKLSHPNVVTVYDVGVVDEQVYIVMEWVRGQNLRAYGRTPRTVRELVAIYRAAGEGLAAAHAEGLIHRDFKPDNAIRGDDGRVRVLDFGLARNDVRPAGGDGGSGGGSAPSSDMTRGAGTPKYMPPEQAEGGVLTPAVDQYAFCVSLREALAGRNADGKDADIPGWIEAIVIRGTAREAKDRFPAMADLLYALARDPVTIWRRRAIAGGALAATVAAFVIGNLRASGHAVEPCSGSRQDIARTFRPAARAQMALHLNTLGAYGTDEATRLDGELASYADRWAASHHTACLANERGELTAQLYERNLSCLGRARVGLETVLDVLAHVPGDRLSNAIVATRGLPDTERCLTETLASTIEPPPPALATRANALGNEVARLRVLAQAADPGAAAAATAVVARSQELGYLPLLARAYLVQGIDLLVRREIPRALPVLEQAATTAIDAGDEAGFVEAYAREVYEISRTDKAKLPANAAAVLGAIPYVEHIARRLGAAAAFERPLLFNNIGSSRLSAGDKAGARAWFARAMDEPRAREDDVELVSAFGNLALVTEQPDARDRLFVRERDTLVRLLGPNHIKTLEAMYKSSVFATRPDVAASQIRDVCGRVQTFHAREAADLLSRCAYELGWLAEERGDAAEARASMQRVDNARKPIAQAYLAALDGKLEEAVRQAGGMAAGAPGAWWTQFYAADGLLFAAICADRLRRPADAIASLRKALALYDELTVIKQAPYYLRRTARARALLARLLAASNPAEAKQLAGDAAAWYRAAGGYDAITGELAAIAGGAP